MKITLTRHPTAGGSGHGGSRSWVKILSRAVLIAAALFVLSLTFVFGGLAFHAGLRPETPKQFAMDQLRSLTAQRAPLDTLAIDMSFNNLEKVRSKREEALSLGLLISDDGDFVPASVNWQGNEMRVKMRLKGDLLDHLGCDQCWTHEGKKTDKWSFRIHMQGDARVLGMKRFSIQSPHTRSFHFEQGFLDNLRYEGVLAPRYQFINVEFNGKFLGIYALEEFMSKEMLEASGRRQGVILAMDENPFWERTYVQQHQGGWAGRDIVSRGYRGIHARLRVFQDNSVAQDPNLLAQAQTAIERFRGFQEGSLQASDVFDVDLTARYLAVVDLWAAEHTTNANQFRWYYNPITTLLEPIGFDGTPVPLRPGERVLNDRNWMTEHLLPMLYDPEIATALVRQLDRVSRPGYLAELRQAIGATIDRSWKSLIYEYPHLNPPWDKLGTRQGFFQRLLDPPLVAVAYGRTEAQEPTSADGARVTELRLDVANILSLPLEVTGLEFEAPGTSNRTSVIHQLATGSIQLRRRVIGTYPNPDDPLTFVTIQEVLSSDAAEILHNGGSVLLQARILGQDKVRRIPVTSLNLAIPSGNALPSAPGVEQVLETHPFLSFDTGGKTLTVQPGTWQVEGNLAIPDGLALEAGPGTILRFEEGAILFTSGPLRLTGSKEAPVELRAADTSWAGVLVVGADSLSTWENVIVRDTAGLSAPGLAITGGVTYYRSSLDLRQVGFFGSTAEDALNVVLSPIAMYEVEFSDTASDAFDGDSVTGAITSSLFNNVAGDAIDLSASQVTGGNIVFQHIGDKAVSVGEATSAHFTALTINDTGIGIASKDGSSVEIEGITIAGARHVALAAYQKKPEYGPADIQASRIEITNTAQHVLAQTNSSIIVDKVRAETTEVDVAALYEAGFLGN